MLVNGDEMICLVLVLGRGGVVCDGVLWDGDVCDLVDVLG